MKLLLLRLRNMHEGNRGWHDLRPHNCRHFSITVLQLQMLLRPMLLLLCLLLMMRWLLLLLQLWRRWGRRGSGNVVMRVGSGVGRLFLLLHAVVNGMLVLQIDR